MSIKAKTVAKVHRHLSRLPALPLEADLSPLALKAMEPSAALSAPSHYRQCSRLLGGARLIRHPVDSRSTVHAAVLQGLPYASLMALLTHCQSLGEDDVARVLGISARTLRRHKDTPAKPMPPDLASKTWQLAETLAKASQVFGGQAQAEAWMTQPAMALDHQRPIDLMQTLQGAELVSDLLTRLEYGVYT
jgi:putative toxin-antitoxin system antitoxin component (TIGR02293 family)